jgi:hypothetical protein
MNLKTRKDILIKISEYRKGKIKTTLEDILKDVPKELFNDEVFFKYAVKLDGSILKFASESVRNKKEIVLAAIKDHCWAIRYTSDDLKQDKDIVFASVRGNSDLYTNHLIFPEALKSDIEFLEKIISVNANNIVFIPEKHKNSSNLYLLAIRNDSSILDRLNRRIDRLPGYIEEEFNKKINDIDFCYEAVLQKPSTYNYLPDSIKKNKLFITKLLENINQVEKNYYGSIDDLINSILSTHAYNKEILLKVLDLANHDNFLSARIFKKLPIELLSDNDFMIEAIKRNGLILEFASNQLLNNPELVLEAVENINKTKGEFHVDSPLKFASDSIKNTYNIVLEAVKRDGTVIKYASKELQLNQDILLEAVKNGSGLYDFLRLPKTLQTRENLLITIRAGFGLINLLPIEFNRDVEIISEIVKKNGQELRSLLPEFQNNFDIVLAAVKNKGISLKYASVDLKNNYSIVLASVQNMGEALEFASDNLKNDFNIVKAAIEIAPTSIQFASDLLKDNKQLALIAIEKDIEVFRYISDNLKQDKELALIPLKKAGVFKFNEYWKLISSKLKSDLDFLILKLEN